MSRVWLIAVGRAVRRGPWPPLLTASLVGWIALVAVGRPPVMAALCGGRWLDVAGAGFGGAALMVQVNGAATLLGWWLLMLLAMTPPLLGQPLRRLWRGSLARRRGSVIFAFIAAYAAVWIAAGPALLAVAGLLGVTGSRGFAVAVALIGAWSLSPARRACLAGAHRAPRLRVFGLAAEADGFTYGAVSAFWCLGACWPLMLAPLLAGEAHLPAMALAAGLMAFQRLVPASSIRWDPPLRPARI